MSAQCSDEQHLETTVLAWLAQLYDHIPDGWLTLSWLNGTGRVITDWAPVDDYDTFTDHAARRAPHADVWWGVATRTEHLPSGRGEEGDCGHIPALWVDIDIAGPGHKTNKPLPPDEDAARQLLASYPLPPTTIVHSGGGLQAWWLLDEPLPAADARPVLTRWGHTWGELGRRHCWHVDNVFDVARIMRLPGTWNRKLEHPRPVVITENHPERRYGLDDLDQHLQDPPPPATPPTATKAPWSGPQRPGDAFNEAHTTRDVLTAHGWTFVRTDSNGREQWTRPGKDPRHGTSATIYPEDGHVTIWSDAIPGLDTRRPYDAYGLHTILEHGGNFTASSDALEQQGYGSKRRPDDLTWVHVTSNGSHPPEEPAAAAADVDVHDPASEPGATWRPTDIAAILTGIVDGTRNIPTPTLGEFHNAAGALWYPGRINGLYGESGTGKTWIALAVAFEVICRGGTVAWIDLEEPAEGILHRLIALGLAPELILERFIHFAPDETVKLSRALQEAFDERRPDLVVIDSTGEALATEGAKPNNDEEVAAWFRWPRWICTRWDAAVVVIDHVIKDVATRGLHPGGSQRKKAAITGAAFMVETITELGRGRVGLLKLTTAKDRNGHHVKGHKAAEFTLDDTGPTLRWRLEAPNTEPGSFRPTTLMERISKYLEVCPDGASGREIEREVTGKNDAIRAAIGCLLAEGYVDRVLDGQRHIHRLRRPFSADPEWVGETS